LGVPARKSLPPEQLREAIRDLTGILRAVYLAEHDSPHRRAAVVEAGKRLVELAALVDQPGTDAYNAAMRAADPAMNDVLGGLHFNASLAPVLGHAAGRVLASRRR
jgi:uncharacterized protein (DUF2342 family)